jgi:hypothetical protein
MEWTMTNLELAWAAYEAACDVEMACDKEAAPAAWQRAARHRQETEWRLTEEQAAAFTANETDEEVEERMAAEDDRVRGWAEDDRIAERKHLGYIYPDDDDDDRRKAHWDEEINMYVINTDDDGGWSQSSDGLEWTPDDLPPPGSIRLVGGPCDGDVVR